MIRQTLFLAVLLLLLVQPAIGQALADDAAALQLLRPQLRDAVVAADYLDRLHVAGGTAPYTWSAAGDLPAGLRLDSAKGEISGRVKTSAKTATVQLTVTDSSEPPLKIAATLKLKVILPLKLKKPIFKTGAFQWEYKGTDQIAAARKEASKRHTLALIALGGSDGL